MEAKSLERIDLQAADEIVEAFRHAGASSAGRVTPDNLIPLLQRLQEAYGYLPLPVLHHVGARTGIPTSRMYGVATFYAQFSLTPRGRHTVVCCRGTACHVRGGLKVIDTVRATLGMEEGQTTDDMFVSFETVACLGGCAQAPILVVDGTYHGGMSPRRVEGILTDLLRDRG